MRTKGKGKLIGTMPAEVADALGIQAKPLSVYVPNDLRKHLKQSNHQEDYMKYGEQLINIINEPHWTGSPLPNQYLFVKRIGQDYVYVPIHYRHGHFSIRSFYIKDNHSKIERLISQNHLKSIQQKNPSGRNSEARVLSL